MSAELHAVDVIRKKRDGEELTPEEIRFVVEGAARETIPEEQLSAWLMAVFLRGLTLGELDTLTTSMRELRGRLERRAEDSAATIGQRLENAKREIERWRFYDYVVINDDLQHAYGQIVAIVEAERARGSRVAQGVEGFVAGLLAD